VFVVGGLVAFSSKSNQGPSDEEVKQLPDWSFNASKRGKKEGDVQMFKKDGKAIAAQWSEASETWIEVGEVVGSRDQGEVEGVSYDYVIPIEIEQTKFNEKTRTSFFFIFDQLSVIIVLYILVDL